jgi:hypothetical protein
MNYLGGFMRTLRDKLTYANVISTLCLFMLLGGGAYAATQLPKNSVGTKQLKNSAVTGKKIKNKSIGTAELTPAAVSSLKGAKGEAGPAGAQGPQGTTNGGAYATLDLESGQKPIFAGDHPGFADVKRVATGIYCFTTVPGTNVDHPLASVDLGDSGGGRAKFVEPLANGAVIACDPGQLEVQTFELVREEPSPLEDVIIREPSDSVAFTVFAPAP